MKKKDTEEKILNTTLDNISVGGSVVGGSVVGG